MRVWTCWVQHHRHQQRLCQQVWRLPHAVIGQNRAKHRVYLASMPAASVATTSMVTRMAAHQNRRDQWCANPKAECTLLVGIHPLSWAPAEAAVRAEQHVAISPPPVTGCQRRVGFRCHAWEQGDGLLYIIVRRPWRSLSRRQHSSQLQHTIRRASKLVSSSAFARSWSHHSGSIICHVGATLQDAVHQLALLRQVAKPVRIGQDREAAREAVQCSPVLSAGSCSGCCSGCAAAAAHMFARRVARAEAALAHCAAQTHSCGFARAHVCTSNATSINRGCSPNASLFQDLLQLPHLRAVGG